MSQAKEDEEIVENSEDAASGQPDCGECSGCGHDGSCLTAEESEAISREREDFKNKYWRLLAETENSRRRMEKEKENVSSFAVEALIMELLTPLDQFEQALHFAESSSEEVSNWAKGFCMIFQQMKDVFATYEVHSFEACEGDLFDPLHHEALEVVESADYVSGTVIKQFQKGYKMKGRVIKPAKVKVVKQLFEKKNCEDS